MDYDTWLQKPYNDYHDACDETEAFYEWAAKEWEELSIEYEGETLYYDGESIFYVSDISWVSARDESEWDYKTHHLAEDALIKIIMENL